jgi:phytol kinase
MDNPLFAMFLPPMLIVPAMGVLSRIPGKSPLGCELRRKALHIGTGLAALGFPWLLTEAWMVMVAFGSVVVWMIGVRRVDYLRRRFGCVLHDAGRDSCGELYFAVALAWLLIVERSAPVEYVIPVLILTISDAAAAIVGRSCPVGRFTIFGNQKTAAGAMAFLLSAFAITFSMLCMGTSLGVPEVLWVSVAVAAATCVAEAVSVRGLDNLSVPFAAWLILSSITYGA